MKIKASYRNILIVAMPLVIGNLAGGVGQIVDTAFVNRIGESELNGAVLGSMIWIFFSFILLGFSTYAQMLIARKSGEDKHSEIGEVVNHLLILGLGILLFILGLYSVIRLGGLSWVIHDVDIVKFTFDYLDIRIAGLPIAMLIAFCAAYFSGLGRTFFVAYYVFIFITINLVLDYLLIFGHFSMPALGVRGAALATVIAQASGLLFYSSFIYLNGLIKEHNLFRFGQIKRSFITQMIVKSSPLVLQNLSSIAVSLIFFIMIEKMGGEELRISFVIRSLYLFICIPIFALGQAVNTVVSNILGQGRKEQSVVAIFKSHQIGLGVSLFLCTSIFIFRDAFLHIYTNDVAEIQRALPIVKVILVATILFTISMININAIIGIGDTKAVFFIGGVSMLSYLLFAYFSIFNWKVSILGVWMSEVVNWGIFTVLSSAYLLSWRSKAPGWRQLNKAFK